MGAVVEGFGEGVQRSRLAQLLDQGGGAPFGLHARNGRAHPALVADGEQQVVEVALNEAARQRTVLAVAHETTDGIAQLRLQDRVVAEEIDAHLVAQPAVSEEVRVGEATAQDFLTAEEVFTSGFQVGGRRGHYSTSVTLKAASHCWSPLR